MLIPFEIIKLKNFGCARIFSSNYFQTRQHIALLRIYIGYYQLVEVWREHHLSQKKKNYAIYGDTLLTVFLN